MNKMQIYGLIIKPRGISVGIQVHEESFKYLSHSAKTSKTMTFSAMLTDKTLCSDRNVPCCLK